MKNRETKMAQEYSSHEKNEFYNSLTKTYTLKNIAISMPNIKKITYV